MRYEMVIHSETYLFYED